MGKVIAVLGSTGSVGRQALEVVESLSADLKVHSLAAGNNIEVLEQQIRTHHPRLVSVSDAGRGRYLQERLKGSGTSVVWGGDGLLEAVSQPEVELVLVAVSGSAGLKPTLKAIDLGKEVALANKETLVIAGHLVTTLAREKAVTILPVDSEHSALFHLLHGDGRGIQGITLTASGGPFRDLPLEAFSGVTPAMALKHPSWNMGKKVTVDSASLMNKGLEIIEAHWLFDFSYSDIKVVIHPQSIIHGVVQYVDGSNTAYMGLPDMRLPIQAALTWPDRLPRREFLPKLENIGSLDFYPVEDRRFPALAMARRAGECGGTMPVVLNAADEVAIDAFLHGYIPFTSITSAVAEAMEHHHPLSEPGLEAILETDTWARAFTRRWLGLESLLEG